MSQQDAVPPETFHAEELEEALTTAHASARRVKADQRWRLAEAVKVFMVSRDAAEHG